MLVAENEFGLGTEGGRIAEVAARVARDARSFRRSQRPNSFYFVRSSLVSDSQSLPDFHDQLCNVLYGEEYVESAPHLQHDDAIWLVDYLDTVRRYAALPRSLLNPA